MDILERFKIYLEDPSLEFDLQMIAKCHMHIVKSCASAIVKHAMVKNNHKEVALLVLNFLNLPKYSVGIAMRPQVIQVFNRKLYKSIKEEIAKMYACANDHFDFKKLLSNSLFSFVQQLNALNLIPLLTVTRCFINDVITVDSSEDESDYDDDKEEATISNPIDSIKDKTEQQTTAVLRSLEFLIRHIMHPTFTKEKLKILIGGTKSIFKKCSLNGVQKFHERIKEIVNLSINYYFPTSEYENTAVHGDEALKRFIFILCEFHRQGMIKNEIFMKFALKLYQDVMNDQWKRKKIFFIQLFEESSEKLYKLKSSTFTSMLQLNENILKSTQNIENYRKQKTEVLKRKGKKIDINAFIIEDDEVVKFEVKSILDNIKNAENIDEATEEILKIKHLKKIHVDAVMNQTVEDWCKKHFEIVCEECTCDVWLQCKLRNLIFYRAMTRRGVARIYQTLTKYMKICYQFYISSEKFIKWSHECFMGSKPLEVDVRDIIEVMLKCYQYFAAKVQNDVTETIQFLEKILENHEKNLISTNENLNENHQIINSNNQLPSTSCSISESVQHLCNSTNSDEDEEFIIDYTGYNFPTDCERCICVMLKIANIECYEASKSFSKVFSYKTDGIRVKCEILKKKDDKQKLEFEFHMNHDLRMRFEKFLIVELLKRINDNDIYFEIRQIIVKVTSSLIDSIKEVKTYLKDFLEIFLPVDDEEKLKLLDLALIRSKDKIIEMNEKAALAKLRNHINKIIKKKKFETKICNQVLRKVNKLLSIINDKIIHNDENLTSTSCNGNVLQTDDNSRTLSDENKMMDDEQLLSAGSKNKTETTQIFLSNENSAIQPSTSNRQTQTGTKKKTKIPERSTLQETTTSNEKLTANEIKTSSEMIKKEYYGKILEMTENLSHDKNFSPSIIEAKVEIIKFIKFSANPEIFDIEIFANIINLLCCKKKGNSIFTIKVIAQIFGSKFYDERKLTFEDTYKYMSKDSKVQNSPILKLLYNLNKNNWQVNIDFKTDDFDYDEALIYLNSDENAIDEFIKDFWKHLLESELTENLTNLIENCTKFHEDFSSKLKNFMAARMSTFQNLPTEFLDKEIVKMRLGRVSIFIFEMLRIKIIDKKEFENWLTSKLIDKITFVYVEKILITIAKIDMKKLSFTDQEIENLFTKILK
ncbi:hypothetical protein PVAND_017486 [Polypedilum vanderplanki]|nr:hypothetical protein PVAND_017486 [Polypedilum vanderplanki]